MKLWLGIMPIDWTNSYNTSIYSQKVDFLPQKLHRKIIIKNNTPLVNHKLYRKIQALRVRNRQVYMIEMVHLVIEVHLVRSVRPVHQVYRANRVEMALMANQVQTVFVLKHVPHSNKFHSLLVYLKTSLGLMARYHSTQF